MKEEKIIVHCDRCDRNISNETYYENIHLDLINASAYFRIWCNSDVFFGKQYCSVCHNYIKDIVCRKYKEIVDLSLETESYFSVHGGI
jgi:hypothetical protein